MRTGVLLGMLVAACGGGDALPYGGGDHADAAPDAAWRERTTTDQPDDVAGAQIHVIYVLASDGVDHVYDRNGQLESSVAGWNGFVAEQTGGSKLRLDTASGALDLSFAQLPHTEAELSSNGVFIRDVIEDDLAALGFAVPNKLYAVYYDGPTPVSCGGGAWPPDLVGQVGAVFLRGAPAGAPTCDSNPLGGTPPGYLDFAMLHEVLHTLGMTPSCAPHQHDGGHTSDSNHDVMYAGTDAWLPSVLDPGHDDYYLTGSTTCPDLANSAFLDPLPANAEMPPGWPALP